MKLKTNKKAVLLYSNKRPAFLLCKYQKIIEFMNSGPITLMFLALYSYHILRKFFTAFSISGTSTTVL
jgi:hypothetical protein